MRTIVITIALVLAAQGTLAEQPARSPLTALAFTPDGKGVVVGSQDGLRLLAATDLKLSRRLETNLSHVHDLVFSPDGRLLVVAGGTPGESGEIELLRWPDAKPLYAKRPHQDLVYAAAFSPDGRFWASAGYDRTVRVHRAATGEPLATLRGHSRGVLAVCFLPEGKTLVSAGADHSLRVWDVAGGRLLRTLENHTRAVHDLTLRPGQPPEALPMLASASDDRTVRLWQPTIGRLVRFVRLDARPLALAWSRDGTRLAASCTDGKVRMIDPDTVAITGEYAVTQGWAHCLAFSSSPRQLVAGGWRGEVKRIRAE